ncbi:unnamed protein product [Vitrella brassicaformis CCMP3155]|uniref:Uncharacterized protein n=1 Tax=Vitrella brassicaformis (strain CCMP3155) TaxID=1169540 RepID=A0A0G4ECU1_VITBC|nr:unnamed protein product [Vitrella brassicaformis CCMP3155]|mmetsp:Transcript_31708/g.78568  ORF Transcript_31708/g.78568 Transcript_31708/m.78568 type:complete len:158 (+) Transcript_31708:207-680(+)|eukprot:CEL93796.1 unnamed protein product [Vitrella brassicaformis CCMP3155]
MEFPAFRTAEWIRDNYSKGRPPPEVLEGVDLSPRYMLSFETIGLYMDKVRAVKDEIRRALFRQSLYKVQNVEVTYMASCPRPRVLKTVEKNAKPLNLSILRPKDVTLLCEEFWTVDRCGSDARYRVRYYKEGGDGFSSEVYPCHLRDMFSALRYYLA